MQNVENIFPVQIDYLDRICALSSFSDNLTIFCKIKGAFVSTTYIIITFEPLYRFQ